VFQALLVVYVLLTGQLVEGVRAIFFGLQGGGQGAFTAAILLAIAIDVARIAPLFFYARHPLGIFHPLILTIVVWPLLVSMPRTIEELGGLGGLFLGEQISPPFYSGLGWLPGPEIWSAAAWANLCELVALLAIYGGFALVKEAGVRVKSGPPLTRTVFDDRGLRRLAIALIGLSVGFLFILVFIRGGIALHVADMARGRFRSMAGLGPLVAAVDLGLLALMVWIAARPNDVKSPVFLASMVCVAIAQFISNGARSAVFVAFMLVGLVWALRTRRVPWRLAAIMIPLFFLSFGALNIIRNSGLTGQTANEAIRSTGAGEMLVQAQEEIELRRSLESTVPVIWQGHDLMGGPLWGSTYAAAIFAAVPRSIWPAKPRGPGSVYAQTFLGEVREGLAVPVNPTAEVHWNFGFIGVILMSVFYGALIRHAHNFYLSRPGNPFAIAGFALFVTTFHLSTDDLVAFQQEAALLLIVLGFSLVFAVVPQRTVGPVTPQRESALRGTRTVT
jgi:hypothetical protein